MGPTRTSARVVACALAALGAAWTAACVGDEPAPSSPSGIDGGPVDGGTGADAPVEGRCTFGTSRFGRCTFGP